MVKIRQLRMRADESLGVGSSTEPAEPFGDAVSSCASQLDSSSVGIAFYDQRLQCKAVNAALTRMIALPASAYVGKTIHQSFREDALALEPIFQRVWESGNAFSNFLLTAQSSAGMGSARWLVNLFPIKDQLGQVRLIAATFSEVTKTSSVELHLSRLRNKFRPDVPGQPDLFGADFTYLSMRTFNLVKQSVELLKCSMSLRCHVSEARIKKGLWGQALFLSGTRRQRAMLRPSWQQSRPGSVSSLQPAIPNESELPPYCPSPRERQVLYLLSDGKSNKEIGVALDISTRTVEFYRARIMLKLDLHSTAALVRYAVRNNIVEA